MFKILVILEKKIPVFSQLTRSSEYYLVFTQEKIIDDRLLTRNTTMKTYSNLLVA